MDDDDKVGNDTGKRLPLHRKEFVTINVRRLLFSSLSARIKHTGRIGLFLYCTTKIHVVSKFRTVILKAEILTIPSKKLMLYCFDCSSFY